MGMDIGPYRPDQNRDSALPDWTRYDSQDFAYRLAVMADELGSVHAQQNKYMAPDKFQAECISWLRGLEHVPSESLGKLMQRASDEWKENYPMVAGHCKRVWDDMRSEQSAQYMLPSPVERERDEEAAADDNHWEVVDHFFPESWNAWHGLPADWRGKSTAQSYPEESDLYGKDEIPLNRHYMDEFLNARLLPRNFGPVPRYWHVSEVPPAVWEQMPNKEAPQITRVKVLNGKTLTYARWVDRCPTIDFGDEVDCPGYVIEHYGPEGKWEKPHACPMHYHNLEQLRVRLVK